jgi:predicted nucleic acid-binding protein
LIALDTNILVYAQAEERAEPNHLRALEILNATSLTDAIIPLHVYGEFLNVCRRKLKIPPIAATEQVVDYALLFQSPATSLDDLTEAAHLSSRFTLQYFDALIIAVATRAGATMLLSEDMHDGLVIDGVTIVNPFVAGNDQVIAAALG